MISPDVGYLGKVSKTGRFDMLDFVEHTGFLSEAPAQSQEFRIEGSRIYVCSQQAISYFKT
jgi:hypothetical protein